MSRRLRLKAQGASSRNLGCRAYIQCVHIYICIFRYTHVYRFMYGVYVCRYVYIIYIYIYMRIYLLTFLSACLSMYKGQGVGFGSLGFQGLEWGLEVFGVSSSRNIYYIYHT